MNSNSHMRKKVLVMAISAALYLPAENALAACTTTKTANYIQTGFIDADACYEITTNTSTPDVAGGASVNITSGPQPLNGSITIKRTQPIISPANKYETKTKGMVTVGQNGSVTFSDNLSITLESNVGLNTRGVLTRGPNASTEINGQSNAINLNAPASANIPAYPGAGIENYNKTTLGNGGTTTITTDGAFYGVSQYVGKLTSDHTLTVTNNNNPNASFTDTSGVTRQVGGLLTAGGKAIYNGEVTVTANGEGSGLVNESYKAFDGYYTWTDSGFNKGGDSTPETTFKNDLIITSESDDPKSGAGIFFGSGSVTQDVSKTTTITTKSGTGLFINQDAGLLAAKNKATNAPQAEKDGKSTKNVIALGGVTAPTGSNDSIDIALGENATITTGSGDGAKISVNANEHIQTIDFNNAGKIKTSSGAGVHLDGSKNFDTNLNLSTIKITNSGEIASTDGAGVLFSTDVADKTKPNTHIQSININNKAGNITSTSGNAIDFSALTPTASVNDENALDNELKITITNTGTISAVKGLAYNGSDFNETFTSTSTSTPTGSTLAGGFDFKDGWDNLTISNTDITGIGTLDGGKDTKTDNEFDTLTFGGKNIFAAAGVNGSDLLNWEKISIENGEKFTLNGDLKVGDANVNSGLFVTGSTLNTSGDTKITGHSNNPSVDGPGNVKFDGSTLNAGGVFNVTNNLTAENNSTLNVPHGGKVGGNFSLESGNTLNLRNSDANAFKNFEIGGDFTGGGRVIFDTKLGDDNSETNQLIISGTVSGTTTVEVHNKGGTGAATSKGIALIDAKNVPANAFTLDTANSKIQAGAYEYTTLQHVPTEGFFLQSKYNGSSSSSSSSSSTTPSEPKKEPQKDPQKPEQPKEPPIVVDAYPDNPPSANPEGDSQYRPEVYRPAVSGYAMSQFVNQNAVNSFLGNHLHQRVGEQESLRWNHGDIDHDMQLWGRVRGEKIDLDGKLQFAIEQSLQMVQFGWDLDINRDDQNSRQHTGVYAAYSNANSDIFDRKRAALYNGNTFTGKIDSDVFGLGAYHTRYDENGNYVDLIGGVHILQNHYNDIYGGNNKQRGWGISASVEAGAPYQIGESEHWFVEPQAELTYQATRYDGFHDGFGFVEPMTSASLRPRLGVRVGYNDKPENDDERGADWYFSASVLHELIDPAKVTIGNASISDPIGKDTWMEVGIGGQIPLGKQAYLYGSGQYLHTFDSDSRRGVTGQVGIRYSW